MEIVFDNFYKDYDSWFNTKIGNFVDELETNLLLKHLEFKEEDKILDLGCGTGNLTYKLKELGGNVTGVDISEKMLKEAEKKNNSKTSNGKVEFYKMNGNNLLFKDNSFDCVISNAVFEFIENPKEVMNELLRVVKPNGVIVIGTIQKNGDFANLYSSEICKGTAYEKAVFKTSDDIKNLSPENFVLKEECLFISPNSKEEDFNWENENIEKQKNKIGGFVCVKFKKKKQ